MRPMTITPAAEPYRCKFDFSQNYTDVVKDNAEFCKKIVSETANSISYMESKIVDCTAVVGKC